MNTALWQHFEHDADIGVHGIGQTKSEAFSQAALALTAVITDLANVADDKMIEITCEAPNDELLFADWLNKLIYLMATQHMLFSRFEVQIDNNQLHANAWGEKLDREKHQPTVEVKGATYTELGVYQDAHNMWHARTIVDV